MPAPGSSGSSADMRRALVVVLLVAVVAVSGCGSASTRTASLFGSPPDRVVGGGSLRGAPEPRWLIADALGTGVDLYDAPGRRAPGNQVLANPTSYGLPLVFLVLEVRGRWLHVRITTRPNGATAWIPASQVVLRTEHWRVEVRLGARRLRLFSGRRRVATMKVAIGAPESPTPTGHFYVDAKLKLLDPTGPYGAGQVSVTGFSDVYQTFDGGPGQIAIHGTDQPNLIGEGVSHGCVRVTNAEVLRILDTVPTGSPVDILP